MVCLHVLGCPALIGQATQADLHLQVLREVVAAFLAVLLPPRIRRGKNWVEVLATRSE